MAENTLLLKKYTNRRLYDTEKSVYVTLDYVTETIRRGRPIEVRDAKTGAVVILDDKCIGCMRCAKACP